MSPLSSDLSPILKSPPQPRSSNVFSRLSKYLKRGKETPAMSNLDFPKNEQTKKESTSKPLPLTRTTSVYSPTPPLSSLVQSLSVQCQNETLNPPPIEPSSLPEYFVFTFGDNSSGQALAPVSSQRVFPPKRIDRLAHRCISFLECGPRATWLVSDSGDVWAGGRNNLGQISPEVSAEEPVIDHARHLEEFEALRIKSVANADEHTVVVLESGVAMSYGTNEFGQLGHGEGSVTLSRLMPKRMLGMATPVSQVCCGKAHTLILSVTGQVFACGNAFDGCLGNGHVDFPSTSLSPISSLFGVPIQQITSGAEHCMALSLNGEVFSWGRNFKGRLGIGNSSIGNSSIASPEGDKSDLKSGSNSDVTSRLGNVVSRPQNISKLPPIKYIASGMNHNAAIGPKGCLYVCGDNSSGQLGLHPDTTTHLTEFRKISLACTQAKLKLIACGDAHTLLLDCAGRLISFGRNDELQLGRDSDTPWKPAVVDFNSDNNENIRDIGDVPSQQLPSQDLFFYSISAGQDHSAAVAVAFPAGICREQSQICDSTSSVSGVTDTAMTISREPSLSASTFEQTLTRLGSRVTSLRSSAGDSRPTNNSNMRLDDLKAFPPIVSQCLSTPLLNAFQRLNSSDVLMAGAAISSKDRAALIEKARHFELPPPTEEQRWDAMDNLVPAGCSVNEILSLIQSSVASANKDEQLRILKRRLASVFSDPHRLNCSFLFPGRLPLVDVEGMEEIFDEIEKLPGDIKTALRLLLFSSSWKCLDSVAPHASHFSLPDQIRCLAIILQSRFLSNNVLNLRFMTRFCAVVFQLPREGRRAFVDLLKAQYPSAVFGARLVAHVKMYLNETIQRIGRNTDGCEPLWSGVVLLQLVFLASVEWGAEQRARCIEFVGRTQIVGKVAQEEFVLDAIENCADVIKELTLFRDSSQTVAIDVPVRSMENQFQQFAFIRESFQGVGVRQAPTNTSSSSAAPAPPAPPPEFLDSSMQPVEDQKTVSVAMTGRPQGVFDPGEALTVTQLDSKWTFYLAHQNLCPLRFKRNVIMLEAMANQKKCSLQSVFLSGHPFFFMPVRRSSIVEDALNNILCSPTESMLKPLKIIFDGEEGVDAGGLKREFFNILVETLFSPDFGMFTYNSEARTIWFNKLTIDTNREFFLVGVVLGLALYNDNLLNLQFPMVIWKKLQDQDVGIDDMSDSFPEEALSLIKLLEWPAENRATFEEAFSEMTFIVQYDFFGEMKSVELKAGGTDIPLTYDNRNEYVDLYVSYLLNDSILPQFEAFKKGFLHFQTTLLKTLSAEELHLLVCGSPSLDFNELRAGAKYEGYSASDPYICTFWDVVTEFDMSLKKKFLRFCTGTDRVPLGGLRELGIKIEKNGTEPTERLPTAYTCFNSLHLPVYNSQQKLRRLLVLAIEQFQGFGLQ